MMQIRPVSDLRNKFTDIEKIVNDGEPVFLTKNGYGSMVVLSLESYSNLTENVETILVETDKMAELDDKRMSHDEVFGTLRRKINA
jgi:prevent-host-death family protein